MYNKATKKFFKTIPTIKSKPLSHDKKIQKPIYRKWWRVVNEKNDKGATTT